MKWAIAGILLLIVAVTLQSYFLIWAALLAAGIWQLGRRATLAWTEGLFGRRKVSTLEGEIGDVVTVQVEMENRGRWPVLWTLCEDLLPQLPGGRERNWLSTDGAHAGVLQLAAGQKQLWEYRLKCHRRGYYQLGPLVMETGDVLGMERRFKVLCDPVWLLVRPELLTLAGYDVESRRPIGEIVMTHRLFEDPTRTSGVRQYQAGDPLNRVHWRATARTGTLQSRVFEPTSLAGANLLIDFHRDSFPARDEPMRSELAITAAASIANLLYEMNQQLGLLSNGRDAVDRIRAEGWQGDSRTRNEARASAGMVGQSDRLRPVHIAASKSPERLSLILDQLARLELTDGLKLDQLVAGNPGRLARDATVIAIVSSLDEAAAEALLALRRRGMAVTAIVNVWDEDDFVRSSGLLIAQSIRVHQLRDRDSITTICQRLAALS